MAVGRPETTATQGDAAPSFEEERYMDDLYVVILAAGQGTRMKSALPKVLHPVAGKPMVRYAVENAVALTGRPPIVVIGAGADAVRAELGDDVEYVVQTEQLGTGHAVAQTYDALAGRAQSLLVCYADMPLLRLETLQQLVEIQARNSGPLTILTVVSQDSMGFGRIVRDRSGRIQEVVEEKEATPEQLLIRELNAGVYCFRAEWGWKCLQRLPLHPVGEYYLTDLVGMAAAEGHAVMAHTIQDIGEVQGINNRVHLARAEAVMRQRINERWMLAGVTMIAPHVTWIDATVEIGQDTVIYPNTYLFGKTRVGGGCIIGPNTMIRDSQIGANCHVVASVVEKAIVEDDCEIGPYGHLRPGAHLAEGVHMGNFGEVKNSYLGPRTRMGHFSYIGDAHVDADVNIGAGTVTCNYDGERKHRTEIGAGAFIGSDTMLVAPVRIGARARTGAGAVVTHDVPDGALALGVPARLRQSTTR
jgi:bifunctional UDP-N-acetylglucosamine pyrophosphorylase/glucosamine-1-phosphate N-acetyltransferase